MSAGSDPRYSHAEQRLLKRVEALGSRHALTEMTDTELDRWTRACETMLARPGQANSANRRWRQLLQDAHAERATRHPR